MSTPSSNLMYAVLYITNGSQGWQERYWLTATSYATAITALTSLVAKRAGTLPSAAKIVWSRVSFAGSAREADTLATAYPVLGTSDTVLTGYTVTAKGVSNDPEASIQLRFRTALGQWSNYYLRCIPDDKIENRAITPALDLTITPATPPANWNERIVDLVNFLKANTQHAVFVSKGVPPANDTYNVDPWTKVIVRGVSNRKTGRPFGQPRGRQPAGA